MKVYAVVVLVAAVLALTAEGAPLATPQQQPAISQAPTADSATLTIQFDNTKKTVVDSKKREQVIKALADVFKVPVNKVSILGGIDQGSLVNSQSTVIFKAVGPTTNMKSVFANCEENTKNFLFFSSPAQKAVKKATDTWWPGDSVKIQKASCAKA